jgi:DNA polymerase/3'-5' exonuclease PolX
MKTTDANKKLSQIFLEIAELLDIKGNIEKGAVYKRGAYLKAARSLDDLKEDISVIYKERGSKGIREALGVGESLGKKIEEFLRKEKIKYYEELKKDTAIQQIVTHYFKTKGLSLRWVKENARKKKILYSRFTKPAEQLLVLAGSVEKAKGAMDKVAEWANSRGLDYAIETVFKKWLELDRLKPKEIVKKPYYRNNPMVWSETKKKWYVVDEHGSWLEFADREEEIEWRIVK